MEWLDQLRILLDILIAAVLGGVIGFEREKKDKPIGFRTNMLIASAAALLVALGKFVAFQMENSLDSASLGVDPTRIIHAIIVGVSFIGAGSILKSEKEESIKYLTTAATILFSAGLGIAAGLQLYPLAVGITVLGLTINYVVDKIMDLSSDSN
ncbi:MgtC/SapB family protein [Flavilitoribacter nigricans]|uniref:Magnesium transporter n=1 Tax=Flavilitoribacter nigricans (strain ATCC 23147 / DSM 23189 / NBRC 102662 / NCIMB 1420 / SS-2) TaxID=1122177 RepID=A0A2D0NLL2_FLAN2|nr:MgtC/SapB family protein [Flavilitoribacter nigricans]PHN08633.1 magnesium transporter [Flavilitoribacter nigricans DSM 23189 = NBRC 102662]